MIIPSAQQLDQQSVVKIDEWVEIGSAKFKQIVRDQLSFDYIIKVGFRDPPFLFRDELARVWAFGRSGVWYPLHDRIGNKTYGYRYASMASN